MMVEFSIGYGELFDRISILEIKSERLSEEKRKEVFNRFKFVRAKYKEVINGDLESYEELKVLNEKLWDIESEIRSLDSDVEEYVNCGMSYTDKDVLRFIELARSVYKLNDQRSKIKDEIDISFGIEVQDVKEY